MSMPQKWICPILFILLSAATFAGTTSAIAPGVSAIDFVEAWPATEMFSDNVFQRIVAYPAVVNGRAAARRDIEANVLQLKLWGLRPFAGIYEDLLQARGITATRVAGCVVSQPQLGSWQGYNDVMTAEIERRFGKNFFDEIRQAADLEIERRAKERER